MPTRVLRGVRYSQSVETAGWYVVSEALTNVVKHAEAHQVLISLRHPHGRLLIEIRDDGRGFHTSAAADLGLAGC